MCHPCPPLTPSSHSHKEPPCHLAWLHLNYRKCNRHYGGGCWLLLSMVQHCISTCPCPCPCSCRLCAARTVHTAYIIVLFIPSIEEFQDFIHEIRHCAHAYAEFLLFCLFTTHGACDGLRKYSCKCGKLTCVSERSHSNSRYVPRYINAYVQYVWEQIKTIPVNVVSCFFLLLLLLLLFLKRSVVYWEMTTQKK